MAQPRRVPVQARSKKRYQDIVDAAALLFGQQGFESTTMDQIADGAGTSIGSVYQFFARKEDLFEVIVEQLLAQAELLFDSIHTETLPVDWHALLKTALSGFLIALRREPKYNAVSRNLHMFHTYKEKEAVLQKRFVAQTAEVLKHYGCNVAEALTVATVVNQIFGGSMFQISVFGEEQCAHLIEEMPTVLEAYLSKYLS